MIKAGFISGLDVFWEAGTRTPIARSRVWSPTIGRPPNKLSELNLRMDAAVVNSRLIRLRVSRILYLLSVMHRTHNGHDCSPQNYKFCFRFHFEIHIQSSVAIVVDSLSRLRA